MNVFMTGATGYIGGSVANALLKKGYKVSGLTRDQNKAAELEKIGILPIIGTLDDSALLTAQAKLADIVINAADSDHATAIEALINGLKQSNKILIHTSGSSLIGDDAEGSSVSNTIFNENMSFNIDDDKKARFAIDQAVIQSAKQGIKSIVLCNSMIYGEGLGLHKQSIQLPYLLNEARKSGKARIVGQGINRWSNVHIDDVVSLYLLAIEKAEAGDFYFVENGEASFLDIAHSIKKRLQLDEIQSLSIEEATQLWGRVHAHYTFGSNSRVKSVYTREKLGWKPHYTSITHWLEEKMIL